MGDCTLTYNLKDALNDSGDKTATFTADFKTSGDPLWGNIVYSNPGGVTTESGVDTNRRSQLEFVDASGVKHSITLVDGSHDAHYVENLRFNQECPLDLNVVTKGICEDHDNDFSASDKPSSVQDWARHTGLGWRTCDKLSEDECREICDSLEGCTHYSHSEGCCFPFKGRSSECSVTGNAESWLDKYLHKAMNAGGEERRLEEIPAPVKQEEKAAAAPKDPQLLSTAF